MKNVAFNVTPDWWDRAPNAAKQLVVAAAGALLPQRLPGPASVFAVGEHVFAYDIRVAENVQRDELDALRRKIVDEIDAVRNLLPPAWMEGRGPDAASMHPDDTV